MEAEIQTFARLLRVPREAMHHARLAFPMRPKNVECVGPGVARVNHDRQLCRLRNFELVQKNRHLRFLGNAPVIVESDFADGLHLRMADETFYIEKRSALVRMNTHRNKDKWILFRQRDGGVSADREHVLQAGLARAIDNRRAVRVELLVVQMAVRINQLERHLSRAPTGTSSRKEASTGWPSPRLAATIMPCEVRPRSLRGCRLATMTTLRPTSCSGL